MSFSYGSQVLSSGDIVTRDFAYANTYRVNDSTGDALKSTHSAFVLDGSAQESTRMVQTYNRTSKSGLLHLSCLQTDTGNRNTQSMTSTLSIDPEKTTVTCDSVTATLSKGLSFDSDDSSIYFGASKIFRIKYTSESPERLLFQYLDPSRDEYVTKISCAKNT